MSEHQRSFADLEARIRSAGRLITPSEDHRPRTLELARDCDCDAKTRRKLGGYFVCALFLFVILSPVFSYLSRYRTHFQGPTATEMQQRAAELETQANVGPSWSMFEAFDRWRKDQANVFQKTR
ncbi:hypothetical protein Q31b_39920 [Novipirellula aureliae]|uniref:Transmembrane protein n=1 Tax=Novipirellula aureliae TaxID=2527966 RepID=A0A5C6DRS3_9BACT|nr:hypothetical protein [Novipirellula aureliae]TWU38914.1 hypothetical protein Q31b_39920 [Novipirellula aureliae]